METKYLLDTPCTVIYKISEFESLVELQTADHIQTSGFFEDETYIEPIYEKIIVNNSNLSDKPSGVSEKLIGVKKQIALEKKKMRSEISKERDLLKKEVRELQNKKNDLLKKYKDVEGIEDSLDFMFGDYTHVVVTDSGYNLKILTPEELIDNYDKYDKRPVAFQFRAKTYPSGSKKKKGITARYGQYDCYSGSYTTFVPANSLEDAKVLLRDFIISEKNDSDQYYSHFLKEADRWDISIDFLEAYRDKAAAKVEAEKEKKRLELQKKLEELG